MDENFVKALCGMIKVKVIFVFKEAFDTVVYALFPIMFCRS